jgi:uncharacterized protein YndB with AHSA1/START domain
MTVVGTYRDVNALTLTLVAEFDASVERVWQVWQDPRQLERWWGPPSWPATFERHEFFVGGQCRYYMTGPEGQKMRGWWTITAVEAPYRLEFDDGSAGEDGEPLASGASTHAVTTLETLGTRTRMTMVTTFATIEQLEEVVASGAVQGSRLAWGQIDEVVKVRRRTRPLNASYRMSP